MSEVLAAKVAVEHAAYSFDREFDYLVPARLREEIAAGKRWTASLFCLRSCLIPRGS